MRSLRTCAALVLLLLPVLELSAHARIRSQVVRDEDLAAAAAFVKSELGARDLIVSAPRWTDPLLRLHLGDAMTLDMAGASDSAAYERLWVLSVRGALPQSAPKKSPELSRSFGTVRVLRYALGPSPVLFDFVAKLADAKVSLGSRSCPYREGGVPRGGGLGKGVLYPLAKRFECDVRRPWLFVGSVVMEDLELLPRHCIWQHAAGNEPISAAWDDVPLGDELVLYGGLYYEHERMRDGGPVRADVFVNGERRGSLVHRDGDGFSRLRIATASQDPAARGQVRIEVTAPRPDRRSFCWAASTRRAAAERGAP